MCGLRRWRRHSLLAALRRVLFPTPRGIVKSLLPALQLPWPDQSSPRDPPESGAAVAIHPRPRLFRLSRWGGYQLERVSFLHLHFVFPKLLSFSFRTSEVLAWTADDRATLLLKRRLCTATSSGQSYCFGRSDSKRNCPPDECWSATPKTPKRVFF